MFYIFVFKCIKKLFIWSGVLNLWWSSFSCLLIPAQTYHFGRVFTFPVFFNRKLSNILYSRQVTVQCTVYTVELYTHIPKIIFNYYYYGRTEQIHRCVLFRNKLILWFGGFSISCSNLHTKYDKSERKHFKLPLSAKKGHLITFRNGLVWNP